LVHSAAQLVGTAIVVVVIIELPASLEATRIHSDPRWDPRQLLLAVLSAAPAPFLGDMSILL
jgi:hypothetical protein